MACVTSLRSRSALAAAYGNPDGTRREIARTPVGDHLQRVRTAYVTQSWLAAHSD